MVVKQLGIEPGEKWTSFLKAIFLFIFVVTAVIVASAPPQQHDQIKSDNSAKPAVQGASESAKIIDEVKKQANNAFEGALQAATKKMTDLALQATDKISDMIIEQFTGQVNDQLDKLPTKTQEKIKKELSK